MELTAFQYADKSLLYFPINFMEVSLLGIQAYRNLCLPPDDTELLVRRLSVVEQNIIRHLSTCVNLNSIVGARRRRRFGNRRLTMQCCSDRDQHYLIPSRINKLAKIIARPRWLRHENYLRSVVIGLCFIVSTIIFNTCLVARNMKNVSHFILSSATRAETILSGLVEELRYWHNNLEWIYGGNKMPPTHPTRIRVESIFGEIISALNVGLKLEGDKRMTVVLSGDPKIGTTGKYYYSVPDHQVTSMMREEVFNRLAHIYTPSHLEGANWKLDVVDSRFDMAFYIRGLRRIVITTGMIEQSCHSEADIAAILGHEVGHGVCSNSQLQFFKLLTFLVYSFRVEFSFVPIHIFQKWFTMREELMADYIGLMLMASAGYDPRSYPVLMERRTRTDDGRKVFQQRRRGVMYYIKKLIIYYLRNTTHPSGKMRIKCLEQVMGEAVTIYEQVRGAASTCG